MKRPTKIQAYTLAELIVVLLVTSIVIGIAFSALTLVQKQMVIIRLNLTNKTQYQMLEQSLWLDFNSSTQIVFNLDDQILELNTPVVQKSYSFHKDKVVMAVDTFTVHLKSLELYYKGQKVTSGQIDALKLTADHALQDIPIFVYKTNDATHFIN